jgi:hypothetical protein
VPCDLERMPRVRTGLTQTLLSDHYASLERRLKCVYGSLVRIAVRHQGLGAVATALRPDVSSGSERGHTAVAESGVGLGVLQWTRESEPKEGEKEEN